MKAFVRESLRTKNIVNPIRPCDIHKVNIGFTESLTAMKVLFPNSVSLKFRILNS